MGLTKQYLRYLPYAQFGIVGSARCNAAFLNLRNTTSRYIAVGSCENVIIWDVRTSQRVMVLQGDKHEATVLARSPDKQHLAVGYSDGSIRIFSLLTSEMIVMYNGHRSTVSSLAYDHEGMRLASGSHDTEIVVWDLVNESGLYRLKGHKGPITACHFIKRKNMLVTSSKDTFVKWWDLDTQHCFKTMVGHRAEVWDFVITPNEDRLVTGSSDSELRVWSIKFLNQDEFEEPPSKMLKSDEEKDEEMEADEHQVVCTKMGSVMRKETDRVMSLCISNDGRYIACHGNNRNVEMFKIRTEEEVKIYLRKKAKKAKKRLEKWKEENSFEDTSMAVHDPPTSESSIGDEILHVGNFKCAGKVRSVHMSDFAAKGDCHFVSLLTNNQIEIHTADMKLPKPEFTAVTKLSMAGHRTDCQSASFASDSLAVLTASAKTAKLWNRTSHQCIRTCATDQATACMFVPGDKQFLIGTKGGKVEVHDIPSGIRMESIECHSNTVISMALAPDKRGVATGSKDKTVKFWDFDLILDEDFSSSTKRLTLSHTRTLQLDDEVTALEFSQNKRLLACALLDCSVKIFYVDTLKFFLSLYGHSLPVTCISMSYDSTIIATGSSDRNIKLWGLDFGDCHKSIFAHDDSITSVKFVPDTHLLFSCGKDGLVKQWDTDKFLHIQTLQGHHGAVWCLAIDSQGDYVVTCGADRSIRLWSRSPEVVIPDEEREREREEEDEKRLVKNLGTSVAGQTEPEESGMATRASIETVKGAERIMEAIELHREESAKMKEWESSCKTAGKEVSAFKPHPLLQAYGNISCDRYVLEVIKKVKSSELEESLLVLPFSYVPDILRLLHRFVESSWEVELSCRCLFFLLRIHHGLISSNQMLVPVLENLQQSTECKVQELQDTIGFNIAALRHLKSEMEAKSEVTFFADATDRFRQKTKKRKKKVQQAVLTL